MNRIVLARRGEAAVEARECTDDGSTVGVDRLPAVDLPDFVREHERTPVRWVWDDTTRWYPALLAAGVRVERCHDLRLAHALLRRSPFVDQALLTAGETGGWDGLQPVTAADPALFPLDDPADRLDPFAEHERHQVALAAAAERGRLGLLLAAESSGALVAAEMTHAGLPWRADVHERLLTELLGPRPAPGMRPATLERLLVAIRAAFHDPGLNPDSPGGLLRALRAAGLPVSDTRSWTLEQLDHPAVPALLEYKKLSRLLQANGWNWLDSWVRDGRFRPYFLPGGVVTGRWASTGGGALSVPTQVRPAAVADDGWRFVVADVAQLEPRVLAGMSGDAEMAQAARSADLYQGMVASGAVASRADAKVGMLGAMYGATRGESGRLMPGLTRRYPRAIGLVEAAARAGERGEIVHTLLGRGSPVPTGAWAERPVELGGPGDAGESSAEDRDRARRSWGRFTRNFVVQGTGAEWALCWLADLRNRLWRLGGPGTGNGRPHLVFFLHDEVVVHTPEELAGAVVEEVRRAAAAAGRLLFGAFPIDFPLDVAVVRSWADAD
ncbi:bifunctional 3'-5' exonuclease/DNA polymerase [Blastococcus sp. CT_GayMR19]|uniref:bifunctional 3'-5' exonuclease/DNA polymerase n=1 Tax=Blastococcus sp. CT_GayMR19 TaxID=2559608 RepID=UPI001073EE29|nr:bifunctional 3'-5' exonuclease/DNA polymerase [Blastococcus sp. CT_GayMR19]TFV77418.1 bifunctional 3'-5' exonuclease/DNA polymerase [Blastococcus sp. CT_GayMR19]